MDHAIYHGNCWIWALLQWATLGGKLRFRFAGAGWVPRLLWSRDGKVWWRFVPDRPVRYSQLPWWRKILPYHVLWYGGRAVVDTDEKE